MVSRLKDLPSYINEVTVPLEDIEFDGDKMILKYSDLEAIKIVDELLGGISTEKDEDTLFEDDYDYDEISKTLEEILEIYLERTIKYVWFRAIHSRSCNAIFSIATSRIIW